ncbi:hypothetical protein F5Y19DRAFT_488841 [Xylariaceae sp. FL1651]|nr:hypothetical protein F5Y19DRAFT_488841 [Xylariaceae sp. FL1651]
MSEGRPRVHLSGCQCFPQPYVQARCNKAISFEIIATRKTSSKYLRWERLMGRRPPQLSVSKQNLIRLPADSSVTFIQVRNQEEGAQSRRDTGYTSLQTPNDTETAIKEISDDHNPREPLSGDNRNGNISQEGHYRIGNTVSLGSFIDHDPRFEEDFPNAHMSNPTHEVDHQNDDPSIDSGIIELQLLRYFQESPGQWMDIFDTSAYFSRHVPLKASKDDLLRFSACAISAKHLHRIQPPEEVFAAITILCQYELIDVLGLSWAVHLSAAPLFVPDSTINNTGISYRTVPRSAIPGPIFWNLARQDILCASIGETQTRLKIENLRLWHHVGLSSAGSRLRLPISPGSLTSNHLTTSVEKEVKAKELICILSTLVNFVTAGDALNPPDYVRPEGQRLTVAVAQEILLKRWRAIELELSTWQADLPRSFKPKVHADGNRDMRSYFESSPQLFPKTWYETPLCAAAMLLFHMGCVLLHANRPQESTTIRSTVSARLLSYRRDLQHALQHAREICGIVLIERLEAVIVHAV